MADLETAVCFESGTLDAMLHADSGFSLPVTDPAPPQAAWNPPIQSRCMQLHPGDGLTYTEQCDNDNNDYAIGFPFRTNEENPAPAWAFLECEDGPTKNHAYFALMLDSSKIVLLDADGNAVDSSSSGVISENRWHWIWVLFEADDSGDAVVIVDDIVVINATGENFHKVISGPDLGNLGATFNCQTGAGGSPSTPYIPNIIILSGCTGVSDLPRRYAMPHYYAPLASATPNVGDDLDSGTWADCFAEIPFSKTNYGQYTGVGDKGIVTTNSGLGIAGPYGDSRIWVNDLIIGGAWLWSWYNQFLPNNRFYGHWGCCPYGDPNTDYTTSEWFQGVNDHRTLVVSQDSDYVPTRDKHFQVGMGTLAGTGARNIKTYDMLAWLLIQRRAHEVSLGYGVPGRPERDVLVG